MTEPNPIVLSYGVKPRRLRRFIAIALVILIATPLSLYFGNRLVRFLNHYLAVRRYLAAQSVALAHTASPQKVDYSDDPRYVPLMKDNRLYEQSNNGYVSCLKRQPDWSNLLTASNRLLYPSGTPNFRHIPP